jgi:hypothetical protein
VANCRGGGRTVDALLALLSQFAALGIDSVYGRVWGAEQSVPLHLLGKSATPAIARL